MHLGDIGMMLTQPDNTTDHEDTYNRNAQAWHYTNARINELIQEAEQALEFREWQVAQWSPQRPLVDSLIPLGQAVRSTTPYGVSDQPASRPQGPFTPVPKKEQSKGEQRGVLKTPLSPDRESQKEERKSAIDAVKQITGAQKEVLASGSINVEDTPEYDWDTRYDGI